ncbi:ABC-2 type transport system permease protein [Krasilnikovia cinnamomea]|uniref:ABC-2 type transport system permease protein n=1 Tax=Krasilnikovia cinnamomea TaxID=349313 RepID=A0A4Q7ZL73_9ACTN|nr:ABC transporter permease [Krasilnikovia cinnamomea]RZU51334.1 ABC-2 type transport system permease protein [Krasilnikovia cinnamomea]
MRESLAAEWLKLRSVRSTYVLLGSVVMVTVLLAAAVGASASGAHDPVRRNDLLVGLLGYGLVIYMALSALSVSQEYSSGTIRTTFGVLPHRGFVVVVKASLLAAVCAASAAVLTPVALLVGSAAAGQALEWDGARRLLWGVPVIVGITAVIAVAVGVLVRRTAIALAIVIIWPLLIEGLTTLVPRFGPRLATLLPFTNAHFFLGDSQGLAFAWPPATGLLVFAGVAGMLLGAAVLTVRYRDV